MKNYIKNFLILIFFANSLFAFANEYKDIYDLAKTLQDNNQLVEACTEYKRYIFMQDYVPKNSKTKGTYLKQSYESLSDCYKILGNVELSLWYIQNAINLSKGDVELCKKHIELLLLNANQNKQLLNNDYRFATYVLLGDENKKILNFAILSHLENLIFLKKWGELSPWFIFYLQKSSTLFSEDEQKEFLAYLEKINSFKPKKHLLAAHFSFVPGLGQLYAHDYKDSLNAFLLNGSLITLSTYSLLTLNFFDFALLEFPFLFRFYRGNLYNAQKDTFEYNNQKYLILSSPLLEMINQKKKN